MLDKITVGRLEYSGISVHPRGEAVIHVAGFTVGPVKFARGMPVSGELGWTDVTVSKLELPDPRAWQALSELGVETMTISFAMAYDWDVAHQHLAVHDTMLKVNELGTLTLSGDLTNITPGGATMDDASLAHATLRFQDASLTERLVQMAATHAGTDPVAFRALIVKTLRQQSLAGHAEMAAAARAVADFITSPQTLTVQLSPPMPIPFGSLRNAVMVPASLVTLPGLSVSANQP